jgi:hypothetical protein
LTISRLDTCHALKAALGVSSASEAYDVIRKHVDAIRQDQSVAALKYAYGLSGTRHTLKGRRDEFLLTLDVWRSHDTLEVWEEQAMDELAARIAAPPQKVFRTLIVDIVLWGGRLALWREDLSERIAGAAKDTKRELVSRSVFREQHDDLQSIVYRVPEQVGKLALIGFSIRFRDGTDRLTSKTVQWVTLKPSAAAVDLYAPQASPGLSGSAKLKPGVLDDDLDGELYALFSWPDPAPGQVFLISWS